MTLLDPIIAQAVPAAEKLTVGNVITGMMFLLTVFGSLGMIIVWVVRYGQTGHALPAAQRGILRVPVVLTVVAIALSVLLMLLVLISAIVPEPVPVGVGNAATSAVIETQESVSKVDNTVDANNSRELESLAEKTNSDAAANPESTEAKTEVAATGDDAETPAIPPQKKSGLTPAQMKSALIQTIAMDLVMFLAFGAVVYFANRAGRAGLSDESNPLPEESTSSLASSNLRSGSVIRGAIGGTMWPDLDDPSSIPTLPGYDILGNRPAASSDPAPREIVRPVPPTQVNPFSVIDEPRQLSGVATWPKSPPLPEEPFSFLKELRFAGEVFLAAYVPTTILRLIIVMISVAISGETPASHPFLEMLNSGISVSMLAVILVTAVVFAPIVEELQFRVVILGGIAQWDRPGIALGVSTFLFAFAHGFPDSIALIPLALALGYAYLRRRSYVTVMLVHFLFNGFNMILALVAML